ncbi:DNA replication/repair protein RecF [Dongshaea marina]|uniref:DNA replication/repair protein RecF n=1 Tax=Dongshaea marina TaxID=2047966 RepID=UPI000D3E8080|nr:DNA replication/repair protein RecF [Dongshaea marina]
MLLSQLNLHHFRNIANASLQPARGINLLTGNNGSGKTSLLEAIHCLGYGRSFRSHRASRIIRHGESAYVLFGRLSDEDAATELAIGMERSRSGVSQLKIGGQSADSLAALARLLPVQLIDPQGGELLSGGPKLRRSFIDWGVFYQDNSFHPLWKQFSRLLKQRNAQLKQSRGYQALGFWDQELTRISEEIAEKRAEYCEGFFSQAVDFIGFFLPEYEVSLDYYQGWDHEKSLGELLQANFERDRVLGYTSTGAHKADLRLKANGVPVCDILSRGQLKLMVCAMRLAQGCYLSAQGDKKVIFLIDDFASELDSEKRHLLMERLQQSDSQIFVTAIDLDHLDPELVARADKMFHVEHGRISEISRSVRASDEC